jgi:hypothetical protein
MYNDAGFPHALFKLFRDEKGRHVKISAQPCLNLNPCTLASLLFCVAVLHTGLTYAAATPVAENSEVLVWKFDVVGTPAFYDEPKIGDPAFSAPKPLRISSPKHLPCKPGTAFGEFEAYITADGTVEDVRSHYVPIDGNACQRKYVLPTIRAWRFSPATFEGKPTPVHIWIGVSPE